MLEACIILQHSLGLLGFSLFSQTLVIATSHSIFSMRYDGKETTSFASIVMCLQFINASTIHSYVVNPWSTLITSLHLHVTLIRLFIEITFLCTMMSSLVPSACSFGMVCSLLETIAIWHPISCFKCKIKLVLSCLAWTNKFFLFIYCPSLSVR